MNFRLGTTSYILSAGLQENAEFLAESVQDMELVLFDLDDGQNNIPSKNIIQALRRIADDKQFGYTVHLPEDLKLLDELGRPHPSLRKAQKAILSTLDLNPSAYVAHLDARQVSDWQNQNQRQIWQEKAIEALEIVAGWVGGWSNIALENLEGYPLDYLDGIFNEVPVGRCVDVGHWWLDGHNPVNILSNKFDLDRVSVIHIHGISPVGKGHSSLAFQSHDELRAIFEQLVLKHFSGVLTLEVFGLEDFRTSLEAIQSFID
jgi:sugar phosphate isomerase/epimerase